MIIALLVVIVLILLFGAGVVKGWLANVVGFGCGGLAILAALLWLGSFFGENGFTYIVFGIIGLVMLLYLVAVAVEGNAKSAEAPTVTPKPSSPKPSPLPSEPMKPRPPSASKQVWSKFAHEIQHRFDLNAQVRAHDLYKAGEAQELEQFCAETLARINQHSPGQNPSS